MLGVEKMSSLEVRVSPRMLCSDGESRKMTRAERAAYDAVQHKFARDRGDSSPYDAEGVESARERGRSLSDDDSPEMKTTD